jgi:hypothetical protein
MTNILEFKRREKVGIKLTYEQINNAALSQAIDDLSKQSSFANFQAAYNVSRIQRQFTKELKTARDAYSKWADDYLVKEDGKYKAAETPGRYTPFAIKEGKETEFNTKMEEFLSVKVVLESSPIKVEDMLSVKITPQQIAGLEPIFDQESFSQLKA